MNREKGDHYLMFEHGQIWLDKKEPLPGVLSDMSIRNSFTIEQEA